jgi:putative spermidine/putrescine transport system permease protein
MKTTRFWAWVAVSVAAFYFIMPLMATVLFSLKMRRNELSFDAYRSVFSDDMFASTFSYSIAMALITILIGTMIIVPTAYWVRLRLPQLRPVVEFVTLLPLVIPAIVIGFGYIRMYNSSSIIPLTRTDRGTDLLLVFGFMTLCLPYMYRAVDTAMRSIDVGVLTEAAESLGASWLTIMFRCIFPNVMSGVLSGAFIAFAIVVGEYTLPSLMNRPAFGPYLALIGANKAYEPSALAVIAFLMTWASIGLINIVSSFQKAARSRT